MNAVINSFGESSCSFCGAGFSCPRSRSFQSQLSSPEKALSRYWEPEITSHVRGRKFPSTGSMLSIFTKKQRDQKKEVRFGRLALKSILEILSAFLFLNSANLRFYMGTSGFCCVLLNVLHRIFKIHWTQYLLSSTLDQTKMAVRFDSHLFHPNPCYLCSLGSCNCVSLLFIVVVMGRWVGGCVCVCFLTPS